MKAFAIPTVSKIKTFLHKRYSRISIVFKVLAFWSLFEIILCSLVLALKTGDHASNFMKYWCPESGCKDFLSTALKGRIIVSFISLLGILVGVSSLAVMTCKCLLELKLIYPSSVNKVTRSHPVPSVSGTAKSKPKSIITSRPKTLLQYDSDSDLLSGNVSDSSNRQRPVRTDNQIQHTQDSTVDGTVQDPSAPAVKNPRIRQNNSNIPKDIRSYFSTQDINVNNYSRSLAG